MEVTTTLRWDHGGMKGSRVMLVQLGALCLVQSSHSLTPLYALHCTNVDVEVTCVQCSNGNIRIKVIPKHIDICGGNMCTMLSLSQR